MQKPFVELRMFLGRQRDKVKVSGNRTSLPSVESADILTITNLNFVAFICAAISGTAQSERKLDKLKIVVGCTNKLSGVTAEEVHEMLKVDEGSSDGNKYMMNDASQSSAI